MEVYSDESDEYWLDSEETTGIVRDLIRLQREEEAPEEREEERDDSSDEVEIVDVGMKEETMLERLIKKFKNGEIEIKEPREPKELKELKELREPKQNKNINMK